jgi:hypothetical protein
MTVVTVEAIPVGIPAEDSLPLNDILADIEALSDEDALKALLNQK